MQAVENKQWTEAARQADALDALQWRLNADHEDSSGDDDGDDKEDKPDRVLKLLETTSLDLRGTLACAQGDTEQGFKLLQLAIGKEEEVGYSEPPQYGRPELESMGYAYLRAGQFDKARETFQSGLKLRPKSGHALYGIALSYENAGKTEEARKAYGEFLMAWKDADPDLPMMRHARQW
jgi:tetratricopeptide (TPR) repeat protein